MKKQEFTFLQSNTANCNCSNAYISTTSLWCNCSLQCQIAQTCQLLNAQADTSLSLSLPVIICETKKPPPRLSTCEHFGKHLLCKLSFWCIHSLLLNLDEIPFHPMRNAFVYLKRHRQLSLLSNGTASTIIRNFTSQRNQFPHQKSWVNFDAKRIFNIFLKNFIVFHHFSHFVLYLFSRFSTAHTSVHGGRPSAEYAKLRKESLESEFKQALSYSSKKDSIIYRFGPLLALYRATIISFHVLKLTAWQLFVHDIKKRAVKVY